MGGFVEPVDQFDPLFFNISPKEAELMDPQERLFIETAWASIEDAGYSSKQLDNKTGVFVGVTSNTYLLHGPALWDRGYGDIPQSLPWSMANRVSYLLNLKALVNR